MQHSKVKICCQTKPIALQIVFKSSLIGQCVKCFHAFDVTMELQWNLHIMDSLEQTPSVRCLEVSAVQRFPTISLILTHFVYFVVEKQFPSFRFSYKVFRSIS